MSIIYPYLHLNDFVNVSRPTGIGSNTEEGIMPVEALLAAGRFDVTFTGLEFRNIGTSPLVVIQSNRAVIFTSVAAILTGQTEAFDFTEAVIITTTASRIAQAADDNSVLLTRNKNTIFTINLSLENPIGQGNAYVTSNNGADATTGDGFIRIVGTYYEIDL